ncbi:hypothetical protein V9T40_004238 [Parthenolecanium corni]|uniref:Uncharacterized protein n=1 Tax=Parthenolecanium corni TaxID=536013 RepID=A0AAN9YAV1_9HEMI
MRTYNLGAILNHYTSQKGKNLEAEAGRDHNEVCLHGKKNAVKGGGDRPELGRHVPKNISSGLDPTLKDNIQYELMNQKPENMEYYSDTTTMYPNCTLPPEIDKDEWFNTSNRINLYFMSQRSAPRHRVKVVHANLNLYKLPFKFNDGKISPIQVDSSPNSTDNKTITVQIFYFKKPLRKVNPGEKPGLPPRIPTYILNILRLSNQTLYQDYQAKYEKLPTLDLTTKDFLEDEYDMFDEDTSRKVRHERQKKNNKQKPKQHRSSSAESVEE